MNGPRPRRQHARGKYARTGNLDLGKSAGSMPWKPVSIPASATMTADREDSAWDIDDPVLTLAALRLLPGNASATIRLDLLRAARERLSPYRGDPGWPNSAADELVPWAREQEDAPAQPFTDRIVGPRGSRLVVAGPVQDAVFALRTLVRALFVESPGLPARDVRRLSGLVGAALDISAEVCRRASLDPFLVPAATGDIIIPEAEMLGRYVHAVSLGAADVGRISGAARALAALSRSPLRSVERRPWGWVVAAPDLLVPDLCRAIADDFANRGRLHALENRYRAAVWSSVVDSMARLGARELVPDHDDLAGTFRLEDDHAAHVTVDSTTLVWDDSRDRIMSSDSAAAALLERAKPSDVVLVIGQPLADPYFDTEGGETGPYALSMSAADLEVLARLPIADSLTLWRFARSAARARVRGGVTRFSTLDEFELYRELGERHPADQGDHHVHLAVRPGTALPLRLLAAVDASTDSVLAPDRSGVIEVRHRFRGVALPVFAAPIGYPVLARSPSCPGRTSGSRPSQMGTVRLWQPSSTRSRYSRHTLPRWLPRSSVGCPGSSPSGSQSATSRRPVARSEPIHGRLPTRPSLSA